MKNTFVLLISLLIGQILFGQNLPISYVNYEKYTENSKNPLSAGDNRICEIILNPNNKFVFWVRPLAVSCLTWREYNGTWKRKNDTIIFSDQYVVKENDARYSFSNRTNNDYYTIKFQTDKKSKLTEKNIEIQFVYDFDAELDDVELNMKLDKNFSLKIPFKNVPNRDKLASIRFEYFLPNGEKRYGYISENKTVNQKKKDLPNFIIVTLIKKPKKEIIYRITKGIFIDNKNKIKVLSTNKTKPKLPDYNSDLKFKEVYKKQTKE